MSFYAVFDRIVPAQNKYMATLFNGATGRKVVVNRIYRFNWQIIGVTGALLEQEIREVTARTAGTTVSIHPEDISDTLTAGIVADHASTSVTEGGRGLFQRIMAVNEEMALGVVTMARDTAVQHDAQCVYWRRPGSKGWVIPTGRGLTIKNIPNSTIGSVSYRFEFDDEPA